MLKNQDIDECIPDDFKPICYKITSYIASCFLNGLIYLRLYQLQISLQNCYIHIKNKNKKKNKKKKKPNKQTLHSVLWLMNKNPTKNSCYILK